MEIGRDEVLEVIKGAGVSVDLRNIRDDVSLRNSGVDSLDMLNTMLGLEERYGVKISDNELERLDTVASIAALLNKKLHEK
jgi:acyl carrier protein